MQAELPILLGIETSGNSCCVGIARGTHLLAESALHLRNKHSERLSPAVAELLAQCGLTYSQLSGVVLSAGPGSFTGLRIGYSLAKGLSHGLGIPIMEVPTLHVWALSSGPQTRPVAVLIDARREEVFYQTFAWSEDWIMPLGEPGLCALQELPHHIPSDALLAGGDALVLQDKIFREDHQLFAVASPQPPCPQIWALLGAGHRIYLQGRFSDTASCEPLYMRKFQGHT